MAVKETSFNALAGNVSGLPRSAMVDMIVPLEMTRKTVRADCALAKSFPVVVESAFLCGNNAMVS